MEKKKCVGLLLKIVEEKKTLFIYLFIFLVKLLKYRIKIRDYILMRDKTEIRKRNFIN